MKENAKRLYEHYCNMVESPKGADSQERDLVRRNCQRAKEDMERKYPDFAQPKAEKKTNSKK